MADFNQDYTKREAPPPYGIHVPPPVPAQTSQPTTVVLQTVQPMVVNFGPESTRCICPHCHAQISTEVKSKVSSSTHLSSLLMCLCCCTWLCCCIPYCCGCCNSIEHYCPNCGQYLGTYEN